MSRGFINALDSIDIALLRLLLQEGKLTSSQVASSTGFDEGAIMIHLARLRRRGLVQTDVRAIGGKRKGLIKCYRATKISLEKLSLSSKV